MTSVVDNKNFLSPLGFRLILNRTPNVEYFCQSATLPTVTLPETTQQVTPFVTIPHPGDHIQYDPLDLRFRVDEDMANYLEIYNWMVGLGFPDNYSQYKVLSDNNKEKVYSDGTLLILTSNNNASIRVVFENMFPTSLSPLAFDVTQADIEYLEATVTMKYRKFYIENI